MRKYPEIGEQVRVLNETGLHTVTAHHKPGRVELSDGRIFWLDGIVTKHQKYITVYVIQQHFGDGWEDVTEEETRKAGIQARKDYRDNSPHPTRLIRRKEPNQLYQN